LCTISASVQDNVDPKALFRRLPVKADAKPQHVLRRVIGVRELRSVGQGWVAAVVFGVKSQKRPYARGHRTLCKYFWTRADKQTECQYNSCEHAALLFGSRRTYGHRGSVARPFR